MVTHLIWNKVIEFSKRFDGLKDEWRGRFP
jgi:hypothetical protein